VEAGSFEFAGTPWGELVHPPVDKRIESEIKIDKSFILASRLLTEHNTIERGSNSRMLDGLPRQPDFHLPAAPKKVVTNEWCAKLALYVRTARPDSR